MPQSVNTFARCVTDVDDTVRASSDFTAALNIALEPGYVTGQRGNVLVPYDLPANGATKCIGGCQDGSSGTSVHLYFNTAGAHRLVRYDPAANAVTTLLEWTGLALSASLVPDCGILDGLFIYKDAVGAVRSVNLQRAADGFYTQSLLDGDPYALHLVKQAPQVGPESTREVNAVTTDPRSTVNHVGGFAWQFAFQYDYPDGERSPLGPFSPINPPRAIGNRQGTPVPPDERNFLRVPYPTGTLAPSPMVKAVRLLVRKGDESAWNVAGTMMDGLPFDFYGGTTGEVLPLADATKPFESIPIAIGALGIGDSRAIVGDCEESYDPSWPLAALTTGVGVAPTTGTSTSITAYQTDTFFQYSEPGPPSQDGSPVPDVTVDGRRVRYFVLVSGTYPDPASRYRELAQTSPGNYTYAGNSIYTYDHVFVLFTPPEYDNGPGARTTSSAPGTLTVLDPAGQDLLGVHDRTFYPVGVAFYDELNRTAGAEAVRSVFVPRQDYTALRVQKVRWALDAATPVPAWAKSYQLLLGNNRTVASFLQVRADAVVAYYGEKDGAPDLQPIGTAGAVQSIWVGIGPLLDTSRGYKYTEGDRLRFLDFDGPEYDVPLAYDRAGYVAIPVNAPPAGVGTTPRIEIYTPAADVDALVLYERGPRYPIDNAGTPQAALTTTDGYLAGDVLVGDPNVGAFEAMLPPTVRLQGWLQPERGRAVGYDKDGKQVRRQNLLRYSGVKVQGTQLNGLSVWDALSQYEELAQEQGAITSIVIADQTQSDGNVLVVRQERGGNSLALRRAQIQTADGDTLLATSKQVIGGSNALRGGFGCTDPGSVVPYAGKVFSFCRERAELVRYDRNGDTPLGETKLFRQRLRDLTARHQNSAVRGGFDPKRHEYWLVFLPADPDQAAETIVFSERRDGLSDGVSWTPEALLGVGHELVTWQDGNLYRHNDAAPIATFGGTYTAPQLTFRACNPGGLLTKTWQAIGINSNSQWVPTALSNPIGQTSRVLPAWLRFGSGVWRAAIRRNEQSPGPGSAAQKLSNGQILQSAVLQVTLTAPVDVQPLTACSIDFLVNSGQQPNQ